MNQEHIFIGLQNKFKQGRLVFWEDLDQSFQDLLSAFNLLDENGQKILLECGNLKVYGLLQD